MPRQSASERNLAVSHMGKPGRPLEEIAKSGLLNVAPLDDVRGIFETNVFGVIAVTKAMLPLLPEGPAGRIVNIASQSGSLTWNSDPKIASQDVWRLQRSEDSP